MALAFCVDNPTDGLAKAFAAHDEYLAIFTHFLAICDDKQAERRMLTPHDDYYPAPFCFLPKQDNSGNFRTGFLVFTLQVPWLHGNPFDDGDSRAHFRALEWMKERGERSPPICGTVEEFQCKLALKEECSVFTFTNDGCYPGMEDVSQALENKSVEVTCAALGWKIPDDWRQIRRELASLHGIPILDLADWDSQRGCTTKNGNDDANANNKNTTTCNSTAHSEQDEKKD